MLGGNIIATTMPNIILSAFVMTVGAMGLMWI